jgi:HD-like signal output (HDOD) protein
LLALPQSAVPLLRLAQNPDVGPVELAVPIESDPGLAAQVLRFVNTSFFGFSRQVSTIRTAITLVGVRAAKNFVLCSAVFSSIPDPKCGLFDLKLARQDSLRRGLFVRAVAKHLGIKEPEEPFTAALLQDVAVPLLAKAIPDVYGKLLEELRGCAARLSDLERRVLGWTHAQAGGMLCRQWDLPERLASLVENHVDSELCAGAAGVDPGSAVVALSALLPSALDIEWSERDLFQQCFARLMPSRESKIADLFGEIDRHYSELAPLLKLPLSHGTLAQSAGVATLAETPIGSF